MRQSAVSNIQNLLSILTKSSFSPDDIQTINNELTTISTFDKFYQDELSHIYFLFLSLFCKEEYFNREFNKPTCEILVKIFEKFVKSCKDAHPKVFELCLQVFNGNCKIAEKYLQFLIRNLQSEEFSDKLGTVLELVLYENEEETLPRQKLELFVSKLDSCASPSERTCLFNIITQIPPNIFSKMVNCKEKLIKTSSSILFASGNFGDNIFWNDGGIFVRSYDRTFEQFICLRYLLENFPEWRFEVYSKIGEFLKFQEVEESNVLRFFHNLFVFHNVNIREKSEIMLSHLNFLASLQNELSRFSFISAEDLISPYPDVAEYLSTHNAEEFKKHVGAASPLLKCQVHNEPVKTPVYVFNNDMFSSTVSVETSTAKETSPARSTCFSFSSQIEEKPEETNERSVPLNQQTTYQAAEQPNNQFPRNKPIVCLTEEDLKELVGSTSSAPREDQLENENYTGKQIDQDILTQDYNVDAVKQYETVKRRGKEFAHVKKAFEYKFNQRDELKNSFSNLIDVKISYGQKVIIVANEESDQFSLHFFDLSDKKFKKKIDIPHEITSITVQHDAEGMTTIDCLIVTSSDRIYMYDIQSILDSKRLVTERMIEIPAIEGYNVKKPNLSSVSIFSDVDPHKDLIVSVDSSRQWVYVHDLNGIQVKSIGISSVFNTQQYKFQNPTLVDVNIKQGLFVIAEKQSFKVIVDEMGQVGQVFSVDQLRLPKGLVVDQKSENVIVSDVDGSISVFKFDGEKLKYFSPAKFTPRKMCIDQLRGELLVIEGNRILIFE